MKEFDDDDDHKQKLKVYPLKMIRHYLLLKYIHTEKTNKRKWNIKNFDTLSQKKKKNLYFCYLCLEYTMYEKNNKKKNLIIIFFLSCLISN